MPEFTPRRTGHLPRSFLFLLVPDFSLMPFTAAIEPLRVANRMQGSAVYSWSIATIDGAPVAASNGALVKADMALRESAPCDAVVVCSGIDVYARFDPAMNAVLRRLARQTSLVGSVCTGSAILADAGLLDGHRCTIHWEDIETLSENYPGLQVTRSLFEIDGDRFTCSGGTAPLDLMLYFIGADFGRDLRARVADQMLHHSARAASEPQRLALTERTGVRHDGLIAVIAAMEEHLESPLSLAGLAARGGMSLRHMERMFLRELGATPARYYRNLRLQRARQMIQQTSMTMMQIAVATGFSSGPHFAKAYGEVHGHPPSRDRQSRRTG